MSIGENAGTILKDEQERNIELFKSEILGSGSYGVVCKAKFEQLICAVKIFHPALFQREEKEAPNSSKEDRQLFDQFEAACRLVKRTAHPNIIQYLGSYHDAETNAPVLLMELMDECLTHFLESSPGDIPYHIQVNLSYDIAQALAFLHANGIIHRDLSSNNVLLMAGSRAKVSDFGMPRMLNLSRKKITDLSKCSGTKVFMPPEALDEAYVITEKLDSFSVGVLIIQIITRRYPEPTHQFVQTDASNPQSCVLMPEVERRKAHLSLIDTTHSLLPVALDCLKDQEVDRPTSQELCQFLGALKEMQVYQESSQDEGKDKLIQIKDESISNDLNAKIHELHEKGEELCALKGQLDDKTSQFEKLFYRLGKKDGQLQNQKTQLNDKESQIESFKSQMEELSRENEIQVKKLRDLTEKLHNSEQKIAEQQQETATLKQQLAGHQETAKKTPLEPLKNGQLTTEAQAELIETQGISKKGGHFKMVVEGSTSTPSPVEFGTPAAIGDKVYFVSTSKHVILEYNSTNNKWSQTREHPLTGGYSVVNIDNILTTVGGDTLLSYSNKLYCYLHTKWLEVFPPMKTKRHSPAVVYTQQNLVVIGGDNIRKRDVFYLNNGEVEILDIETLQWTVTHPLPHQLNTQISATLHNDSIYVLTAEEYYDRSGESIILPSKSVLFTCSVTTLVKSNKGFWHRHSPLFLRQSCLVSVKGHLLAIGGMEGWPVECPQGLNITDNIYEYVPADNLWKVVGELSVPRSDCSTVVLPDNRLMVVGCAEDRATKCSAEFVSLQQHFKV